VEKQYTALGKKAAQDTNINSGQDLCFPPSSQLRMSTGKTKVSRLHVQTTRSSAVMSSEHSRKHPRLLRSP